MPLFGDQFSGVKRLVSLGLGQSIDYEAMTKESLKSSIEAVIAREGE